MNLNLTNFHKVESCDTHTVLEHPNGHKIKVAHKGLSPESMKNLEDLPVMMAKGGYAKFAQKYDPNMGSKASKPSQSSNTMPGDKNAAFTEPNDMGTDIPKANLQQELNDKQYPDVVLGALNKKAPPYGPLGADEKQHYPPCINPSCKSFGRSHPNCRCYGGNPEGHESHRFAEGGAVEKEYYCDATRAHRKGCEYFKSGGEAGSQEGDKLERAKQDVNAELQSQAPVESAPQSMSPVPTPLPAPVSANPEMSAHPQPEVPVETPQPQVATPTPEEAQAPEAAPQQPQSDPVTNVMQKKQQNLNEILPEGQAFASDLDNGHIQPKTYADLFNDKGVLGKLGTIFGLMIGGAGSGLSHQPNLLMDMMNKELERDFQAQQNSVTNKQNYLKINQQARLNKAQTHLTQSEANLKDNALSRIQMNWAALHHLVQLNEKFRLTDPVKYQQGLQQLAMLHQGVQNENFSIADRAATAGALSGFIGGGQQNTMMMKSGLMGPEMQRVGEDTEQKTIPGVPGVAQRPIPQPVRDQVQNMNVLDDKVKDLLSYAKKHEGSVNPQVRAKAQQKANELVGFYSSSLGTSMTEGTRTWLDDQVAKKNPTSIIGQALLGSNSRLQEIMDSNEMRRNTLLGSVGLKGSGGQSQKQNSSSAPIERTDKSGKVWLYDAKTKKPLGAK